MVKSFTLINSKVIDQGKILHFTWFRLSPISEAISTEEIKRFLYQAKADNMESFARKPYPQIKGGSISLSHKKTHVGEIYAVCYSKQFRSVGVDLELKSNRHRCLRALNRYGVTLKGWDPVDVFAALEAGVKAFTQVLKEKVYLSDLKFDDGEIICYRLPGLKGFTLVFSSENLKMCVVIIP